MAWNFVKDIVCAVGTALDCQNVYYQLKEALVAEGWVVVSSSDGTTYNASGDQLTTAGTFAGNRAWFQIRNPASTLWIVIQMDSLSTKRSIRMKVARAAFSSGSPGATQVPATATATDEFVVLGAGTDASPTFQAVIPATGTLRYQIGVDDAAPYPFFMVGWPSGGGLVQSWIFCDAMAAGSYPAGDACPYVIGANSTVNVAWAVYMVNFGVSAIGSNSPVALFNNGGTPTFQRVSMANYYEGTQYANEAIGANYDGEDTSLPGLWLRRATYGGGTGCKGVSSTYRVNGTARATGDTYTASTTRDRLLLPPLNAPWDGTAPTV